MADGWFSRWRRFPFHVHISVVCTVLLLSSGVVLGALGYLQASQIILADSQQLFARMGKEVQTNLENTYQPIRRLLNLLALQPSNAPDRGPERMPLVPAFAQALHDNTQLAALYVGYADGDFLMVRPLRDERMKKLFEAPEQAAFQVWSIDHGASGHVVSGLRYLDARLNLLAHREKLHEDYDPRTRPWYRAALQGGGQVTTDPYVFFTIKEIGTTIAYALPGKGVLGADLTLTGLSATLAQHKATPSTEVVLYSPNGAAVAYSDTEKSLVPANGTQLVRAASLSPALGQLLHGDLDADSLGSMTLGGRRWLVSRSQLSEGGPQGLRLALLAPESELLADAYRIRWQSALVTVVILLLCIPLGWRMSRALARPLHALALQAEAIRNFDFTLAPVGRSSVLEIDRLALAMNRMRDTLSGFLEIAASLSAESRFDALLERVLKETVGLSEADAGLLYLLDAESGRLSPQGLFIHGQPQSLEALHIPGYVLAAETTPQWLRQPAAGGASAVLTLDLEQSGDLRELLQRLEEPRVHMVATGLHNRQGDTVGVLVLLDSAARPTMVLPQRIAYVEAVSGVAALCIESQRLLEQQKKLLNAFIELIAGAIDAKSPYTGGHCQRVPELTLMLARAAADSDAEPFRGYQPGAEEWEALHIAAWLHDCGKVTTPEYVVDKATKLETIHDRIHEVRMRFELLKRDAWVSYWQGVAHGGQPEQLAGVRDAMLATLDDEFAFVATCNQGGEFMAEAAQQRLRQIAARTWLRTLDDRLGISWEAQLRYAHTPAAALPVQEPLLADKPEHLQERPASELIAPDNPWGFKLEVPQYKHNRGELHNLSISRGTLNAEERYLINNHIVQTIRMLSLLPFPRYLSGVAEIAGGHHEKMDGTGYPKCLTREQMSLPARMMAIADIFEALTAADRPYKKGKTLGEALDIMAGMCRGAHVDPDLFRLFVQSGIAQQYAERFLLPQQIDTPNFANILAKAGL